VGLRVVGCGLESAPFKRVFRSAEDVIQIYRLPRAREQRQSSLRPHKLCYLRRSLEIMAPREDVQSYPFT
jgi:hypothetical protein